MQRRFIGISSCAVLNGLKKNHQCVRQKTIGQFRNKTKTFTKIVLKTDSQNRNTYCSSFLEVPDNTLSVLHNVQGLVIMEAPHTTRNTCYIMKIQDQLGLCRVMML